MKKISFYIISAIISMMCLTSCVTAGAMTETSAQVIVDSNSAVAVETEYYDYMNNVVVIYIDGIANYRYWDNVYRRYYYRPVPRSHFGYIRQRPIHHHHHHVDPFVRHRVYPRHHHPSPGVTPRDRRVTPSHPSRDFGRRPSSTRVTPSRPIPPNHSGNARPGRGSHHFGGRR